MWSCFCGLKENHNGAGFLLAAQYPMILVYFGKSQLVMMTTLADLTKVGHLAIAISHAHWTCVGAVSSSDQLSMTRSGIFPYLYFYVC